MGMTFTKKIDWEEEATTREKAYFGVVLLLIAFGVSRLLWVPMYEKIRNTNKEIENIKMQISALEKFIDLDKKMVSRKAPDEEGDADGQITKMLQEMAERPQQAIADVVKDVISKRRLGSMTLDGISFQTAEVKGGYMSIPMLINLRGTFSSLQNYLSGLEKLKYLFTIDNITFNASADNAGIINATLNGSMYIPATASFGTVELGGKDEKK